MSSNSASLAVLLKRLESATNRLEELARDPKPQSQVSQSQQDNNDKKHFGNSSLDFEKLNNYKNISENAEHLHSLVHEHNKLIEKAKFMVKPPTDSSEFNELLNPMQQIMRQINLTKEENRDKKLNNVLTTVSEGTAAFSWIALDTDPVSFIKEIRESAQYYANRVKMEYKDSQNKEYVELVDCFLGILLDLKEYVSNNHKKGLVWNENKGSQQNTPATSMPVGPPPPPPPPKPSSLSNKKDTKVNSDMSSLFSSINEGEGITSRLKHVKKEEMTHKNPNLKNDSKKLPNLPNENNIVPKNTINPPKKEPKTQLESNRWIVENHVDSKLKITPTELKHVVYIYNCLNTTIEITQKCNAITIDNCKKTGIVVSSALSSVDIINSKNCQVQIIETCPTIVADKSDQLQIYLSEFCLNTEILTAKCSQINISVPDTTKNTEDELIELNIPEQFKSTIVNGKVITAPMEHE